MILINPNTINKVVLTLNEKQTISNPDWLFEFINDTTGEIKIFHATDISLATARYNEFIVTDNSIENPYNGTMNFRPVGYWSYTIYEMNATSPIDLDPANAVGIVEIGKVYINGETLQPVVPTFTTTQIVKPSFKI